MRVMPIEGLRRCPCCGAVAKLWVLPVWETPAGCGELFEVECVRCGMTTGRRHTKTAAVIVWQRRPDAIS